MNKSEIKAKIKEIISLSLDKNVIGKQDVKAAKVCIAVLHVGTNEKQVKAVTSLPSLEPYWKNLWDNGYLREDGKVNISKCFYENDIPFIMMVLAAKGFVRTTWKETS